MKKFPLRLSNGGNRSLLLDKSRLLLSIKKTTNQKEISALIRPLGFVIEEINREKEGLSYSASINHTPDRIWIKSTDGTITEEQYSTLEKTLKAKLNWIGPVFYPEGSPKIDQFVCPLPNVILVHLKEEGQNEERIVKLVEKFGLKRNKAKSAYLNNILYFELNDLKEVNAYQLRDRLGEASNGMIKEITFEQMPLIRDFCAVPNDAFFAQQWGMTQIQAPQAWDISTGSNAIIVAVIDSGVDLTHPDLVLSGQGVDLGDMVSDGSPNNFGGSTGHGTCCAGIVAATFNNAIGVSGVAGACRILPIAISTFSDVEIANGLNFSVTNGASVVSMSFKIPASALVDTALANAATAGLVLCAATANDNTGTVSYPARNANVMACGASDQIDNRKSPASPDGEGWGSNFGNEVSVVAPGVFIPSTDIQGNGGFNNNAGGPITILGNNHPSSGDAAGNYFLWFNGTSSATPHVAGLAALVRSQYPTLTNAQTRFIIEKTAQKVGAIAYAETAGKNSGTWNNEMGYGRINAFRAVDFADVMIKDWTGDDGTEPSTPPGGDFWDFSDIVVRINDDNVFNPSNPSQSKNVEKGQSNFIYIQVTNRGPREARNVTVNCRITPYVGLQFVYPADWTTTDAMHVAPTPITASFASVPSGGTVMAKFTISAAQTDVLYGWENSNPWHPCLLASVIADNDYAFATAGFSIDPISQRKNNIAQRNLTVIDVLADTGMSSVGFSFVAGNLLNKERFLQLQIDRRAMPKGIKMLLSLDETGKIFPAVDFGAVNTIGDTDSDHGIIYHEKTKIETTLGCCRGILTLEKGSRFDCLPKRKLEPVEVKGGELIIRNNKRYVLLEDEITIVQFSKTAQHIYPLTIFSELNGQVKKGMEYTLKVSQQNAKGQTLGGATAIYIGK